MSTSTSDLPLDDRSPAIKFSYPFIAFFSTVFVVLRLWNNIRSKKFWYLNVSDWLLALAQICGLIGTCFGYMTGWNGAGKHVYDPTVSREMTEKYLMYLWFGQYFNLTAMAALKFSICAFMLQLGFSRWYRVGIWLTVMIHAALNVVFPYIILFGECDPIAKHWNPTLKGYCWSSMPRVTSGYLGAGSNIITDLFYTFAPLMYIRSVQLPSRVMWGVRVVFLLGLTTTTISVFKLYEVKALNESHDVSYESVNLSILSVTEVLVGSLTASLPPLRRLFENMLKSVLPDSIMASRGRSNINSYVLPDYKGSALNMRKSRHHDSDDSSERTILADCRAAHTQTVQGRSGEIKRTTHVSLTVDETGPNSKSRNEDWAWIFFV